MKKWFIVLLALAMVFAFAACGSEPAADPPADPPADAPADEPADTPAEAEYPEMTVRAMMSGTEKGIDYICATNFKEAVEAASNGKIKVELFASNILAGGSMAEGLNMLTQGGAFELGIYSCAVLCNLDPAFQVCALPFIFDNQEEMHEYLYGSGNDFFTDKLAGYGLVNLGAMSTGLKQWTNNKGEIHSPEDYKNFKMRIPAGEVLTATWKAIGADAVSMSWSEVYTSLQQGVVDGHENSYQTLYSGNIHEVQKYITEVNYSWDAYIYCYRQADWDQLDAATQELLSQAAYDAVRYATDYLEQQEVDIKAELLERGNIINELTDEERAAFKEAVQPVLVEFQEKFGQDAYEAWGIEL